MFILVLLLAYALIGCTPYPGLEGSPCSNLGLCADGLTCSPEDICIEPGNDAKPEPTNEPEPAPPPVEPEDPTPPPVEPEDPTPPPVEPKPPLASWADESGVDDVGTWASVEVSGVELKFRWIEPGTFWMGSPDDDGEAGTLEKPRHQVRLTEGYWLAETEVTQRLWSAVMSHNLSAFTGEAHPVETVSWDDAQVFLAALNTEVPGLDARLPTEAQWEYAARAGTETPRYGPLDEVAWWVDNSEGTTHPVATKVPNAWGLYDMLGNVYEWCQDYFDGDQYAAQAIPGTAIEDPTGPAESDGRVVVRGGGWKAVARNVRAADRFGFRPDFQSSDFGLRLSRGL